MSLYLQRLVARNREGPPVHPLFPVMRPAAGPKIGDLDPLEQTAPESMPLPAPAALLPQPAGAPPGELRVTPPVAAVQPALAVLADTLHRPAPLPDQRDTPQAPERTTPAESPPGRPNAQASHLQPEPERLTPAAEPRRPEREALGPLLPRVDPGQRPHGQTSAPPPAIKTATRGQTLSRETGSLPTPESGGPARRPVTRGEPLPAPTPQPTAELCPPAPTSPPSLPQSPPSPRVVIGRLSVEVVPAPPPTPSPTLRPMPAVAPRSGRDEVAHSMLRFGLGQL